MNYSNYSPSSNYGEVTDTVATPYGNLTVKIRHDESPQDPREWDNIGTMICWHRRYRLGDHEESKQYEDSDDLFRSISGADGDKDYTTTELLELAKEKAYIMPLFLYDHGGITMSTGNFNCQWDSGQVGWIFIMKDNEELKAWGESHLKGRTIEEATYDWMRVEVKLYDDFITGNVFGYRVSDNDGTYDESCWGYFGDHNESGIIDEIQSHINYFIEMKKKEEDEDLVKESCAMYSEPFNTLIP